MYNVYDLSCNYDARLSFYGKARVEVKGEVETLISYNTRVAEYDNETNTFKIFGFYSQTTLRHIKEFYFQKFGYNSKVNKKFLEQFLVF